jgi:hypothetical protein
MFNVNNGMTGMQRDIVLRLCCLLWEKSAEIRAVCISVHVMNALHFKKIIGMCGKHFGWKRHSYFLHGRPGLVSFC